MTNTMTGGNDGAAISDPRVTRGVANPALFFRRWLVNPLQMGVVIPSPAALCWRIVRHTKRIAAIEAVAPGRSFLHRKHALMPRREAWTPLNLPPASVWRYVPGA
jgi:phosphatidylethanolamine/phosphatidyl-N-methylethanolamine N-methyltransferase